MEMTFEIPDNLKAEDLPELYGRYVQFLKDAQVAFHGTRANFDALISEFEVVQASANKAAELLNIYWLPRDAASSIETKAQARSWLEKGPKIDDVFLFTLIEMAGERALNIGYSKHKSEAAKAKNAKPRAWVIQEWNARTDLGQSKASFARQHASLVKAKFSLDVTPDTIRDWLPKG